mgnify:FL=1
MGGFPKFGVGENDKYALGVPIEDGGVWILQTYRTKKELRRAYGY